MTPDELADRIDRDGAVVQWYSNGAGRWCRRLWLAGQLRGALVAGCLCSVLDELGECLSGRGCPSASWPHALAEAEPGIYAKLCPVLFADATGAFAMRPEGGVA